jgi:hypothetical protein
LDLQVGHHCAVKDDDALFKCVEKAIHFQLPISNCRFARC